jgi:hypothetical protein
MSREPTALLFAAFVVTFVLTRGYTRVARVRGRGSGNVGGAGRDVLAIVFGVGGTLVLDEFALSLYLRDVYWSEEGHGSIDATLLGLLLAALLLVGLSPFGVHDGGHLPRVVGFALVASSLAWAAGATRIRSRLCHRLHERLDDLIGGAAIPRMMAIQWKETT